MNKIFKLISVIILLFAVSIAFAAPIQEQAEPSQSAAQSSSHVDHFDELKVNPALQLSEVLEKAYARTPMQASLQIAAGPGSP